MPDLKQLLQEAHDKGATREQLDIIYNAYQENVKKKVQPTVSKTGGYGSQIGSQNFQDTNQYSVLDESGNQGQLDQVRSQNIGDRFKVPNTKLPKSKLGFNQPEVKTTQLGLSPENKVYRDFNAPTISKEFAIAAPEVQNKIGESITKQGGFQSDISDELKKKEIKPTTIGEDLEYIGDSLKRGVATTLKGAVTLAETVARNPLRLTPAYWATKYIDEDLTKGVDGFFSNLGKKTQPYFDTARDFAGEALYTPTGTIGAPSIYEPKEIRELKKSRVESDKSTGSSLASLIGGAAEYAGPAAIPYLGILAHDAESARENLEQIQKANPSLKLSDNEKDAWSIANGTIGQLIFGEHGAAKLLNIEGLTKNLRTKVLNSLTLDALESAIKSGEQLTVDNLNKYTSVAVNDFSKKVSLYGVNAMEKVLAPVRDLTILEASKIAGERLVDAYRDKSGKTEGEKASLFNNTFKGDLARLGQSAATGAMFGASGLGLGMLTGQTPSLIRTDIVNNNIADAILESPERADAMKAKMSDELRNKGYTDDVIADAMSDVDKSVQIASSLPPDFPQDARRKAMEIMFELDDLKELKKVNEQKIIAAPDELKANYAKETELINSRLESKTDELRALHLGEEVKFSEEDGKYYKQIGNSPKEEITETRYLVDNPEKIVKENAVQEPSTSSEVPPTTEGGQAVQEGGEGVGQGEQGVEVAKAPTAKEEVVKPTEGIKTVKLDVNEDLSNNGIGLRAVEMPDGKFGIFKEVDGKVTGKSLGRSFDTIEELQSAYDGGIKDALTADTIKQAEQSIKRVTEVVQPSAEEQAKLHNQEGGSTFTVDGTNRNGTKAASVSIFPERTQIVKGELTKEDIDNFVNKNADIYSGNGDVLAVGSWFNSDNGETYLDVSAVLPKREARRLGKDYNQISVWDLEKGREIPTGGTGEAIEGLKPEIDRVSDIRDILGKQKGLKQAEVKTEEAAPVEEPTTTPVSDIANKIRGLKITLGQGTTQSNIAGLPIAVYNAAIETIALSLEAGETLTNAVKDAIIKHKLVDEPAFDSNGFITDIENTTGEKFEGPKRVSGIKKSLIPKEARDKANAVYNFEGMSDKQILETGRDLVESGAVDVKSIVDDVAMSNNPKALQPNEVVAAIWYKADLDTQREELLVERNEKFAKGEDVSSLDNKIANLQTQLDLYNKMAAITGRQQSLAFRLRKGLLDQDYNAVTQIEIYKKTNGGYIPADVEKRFIQMGKDLDATKAEIARLEKEIASKDEEQAIKNIVDNTKTAVKKVKSILSDAEKARKKQLAAKFRTFNDITRIPTLLVDKEFLEYAKLTLKEASGEFSEFAKELIKNVGKDIKEHLPELYKKIGGKGESDLGVLEAKPTIDETGKIIIPSSFIKELVKSGVEDISDLTYAVREELLQYNPDITPREVRDAITGYGKELAQTKDEIKIQIAAAKRIGKLQSQLEDLQAGKTKTKTPKERNQISAKEAELKAKIKELSAIVKVPKEKSGITEEQRVQNRIKYLEKYIAEKQRRIDEGDFTPKAKPKPLMQTKELIAAQAKADLIRQEYEVAQYANEQNNRSSFQKAYDLTVQLTSGLSKAIKAGFDFSAFLGQGAIFALSTNPLTTAKVIRESFKGAFSEEYEKKYLSELRSSPNYYIMEGSGLKIQTPLTTFGNQDVEKATMGVVDRLWNTLVSPLKYLSPKAYDIAKKVNPGAITERAYTMAVNDMRVRLFTEFENALMMDGKTFETDPKSFKAAANAVNNMTLSGRLRQLEPLAKELNVAFFSARKVTAVLSLCNPAYFVDVYKTDRVIGKQLIFKMATFLSMATAASLVSNAFSDDDDKNPDVANPYSSDFMKIKIGSTRLDPFHGQLAPLILFARFITGNYKSTSSWEQKKLGQDQFTPTRLGLIGRYFGSKLSPFVSEAVKGLDESAGNEVEWEDEAVSSVKPIWSEDINDLTKAHPALMGNFLAFLGYIGMAESTFGTPFFLDPNKKEDEKLYKLISAQNAAFTLKSKSNIKIVDGQTLENRGLTKEEYETYKQVYGDFVKKSLQEGYDRFKTMDHLEFEGNLKKIKSEASTLAKEHVSGLSEGINKVTVNINDEQVEYPLTKDEVQYRKDLNDTYISRHSGRYNQYFKEASKAGHDDTEADYIASRKLAQEANAYSKEKILKSHKQGKYYDFQK